LSGASLKRACVAGSTIAYAQTDKGALDEAMGAPPPMVFIDDQPLVAVLASHEHWCKSEGREGAVANCSGSDFRSAGALKGRKLTALKAAGGIFYGLNLEGVQLQGADLTGADLRGTNLRGADLRGAKLIDALLVRADLRGAKLGPLEIMEGRYVRTDLSRAMMRLANLTGADVRRARLLEADLENAKLDGANFLGAEMPEG
jgi:uncharacterized protein YjbI with pentapeptide repeats